MAAGTFEYAAIGYDCERNVTAEISDAIERRYEFYLDESVTKGLVAAQENINRTIILTR